MLSFERRVFLGVTFSDPNIAVVGKGYSQLKKENIEFVEGKVSFEGQGRSIVKLKEKGLMKVYGCAKTGAILGTEIFGPSGEHLAHLLAWAIQKDMTVHEALFMPFYHPVIEEGLRTALRDLATKLPDNRSPLEIALCQDHPTNKG
jgi:dihydrolipoamide dehydrogenase